MRVKNFPEEILIQITHFLTDEQELNGISALRTIMQTYRDVFFLIDKDCPASLACFKKALKTTLFPDIKYVAELKESAKLLALHHNDLLTEISLNKHINLEESLKNKPYIPLIKQKQVDRNSRVIKEENNILSIIIENLCDAFFDEKSVHPTTWQFLISMVHLVDPENSHKNIIEYYTNGDKTLITLFGKLFFQMKEDSLHLVKSWYYKTTHSSFIFDESLSHIALINKTHFHINTSVHNRFATVQAPQNGASITIDVLTDDLKLGTSHFLLCNMYICHPKAQQLCLGSYESNTISNLTSLNAEDFYLVNAYFYLYKEKNKEWTLGTINMRQRSYEIKDIKIDDVHCFINRYSTNIDAISWISYDRDYLYVYGNNINGQLGCGDKAFSGLEKITAEDFKLEKVYLKNLNNCIVVIGSDGTKPILHASGQSVFGVKYLTPQELPTEITEILRVKIEPNGKLFIFANTERRKNVPYCRAPGLNMPIEEVTTRLCAPSISLFNNRYIRYLKGACSLESNSHLEVETKQAWPSYKR